jgi:hypothetical protein
VAVARAVSSIYRGRGRRPVVLFLIVGEFEELFHGG